MSTTTTRACTQLLCLLFMCSTLALPSTAETTSLATAVPGEETVEANTTTPSPEERRAYLASLQDKNNRYHIPSLVYMAILIAVGVPGNILVILIYKRYYRPFALGTFIMAIAGFDLISNVLAIPGDMYVMFHLWDFDQPDLCKAWTGISGFTTISSAMILLAVAVTRYRAVCKPHEAQVTQRQAQLTCLAVVFIGLLCAIPYLVMMGVWTKKTPRPDIQGSQCALDDAYINTKSPSVGYGCLMLLFVSLCFAMIVLYSMIGHVVWKHRIRHGVGAANNAPSSSSSSNSLENGLGGKESSGNGGRNRLNGVFCCVKKCRPNNESGYSLGNMKNDELENVANESRHQKAARISTGHVSSTYTSGRAELHVTSMHEENIIESDEDTENFDIKGSDDSDTSKHDKTNQATLAGEPVHKRSPQKPMNKANLQMFLVSFVFIVGFVPHIALVLYRVLDLEGKKHMSDTGVYFYSLFLRSYYINCAANPVIYSLLGTTFRHHLLRSFGLATPTNTL